MRRTLIAAAVLLAGLSSLAQAAAVHSHYELVSGNTWTADFTITNDGAPAQITGFTIYLPETAFSNMSLVASPPTWDTLLIPPDLGLPAPGFLDSFVLDSADAIDAGETLGGFRILFEHAGGVPQALSFDINDANFNVLFSGMSSVTAVPEPASMLLAVLALGAALGAARPRRDGSQGINLEIAA